AQTRRSAEASGGALSNLLQRCFDDGRTRDAMKAENAGRVVHQFNFTSASRVPLGNGAVLYSCDQASSDPIPLVRWAPIVSASYATPQTNPDARDVCQ